MKPFSKAMSRRAYAQLSAATLISTVLAFPVTAKANDDLESITVTANRMPTENALAPTTVITRSDIERLQINDLSTLLSRFPGVDMTQNGGMGKSSSISIRGTSSGHVLVLVDGVKWQSATAGSTAFQDFPVEQIERVEIVRGPRSGIYGSEAIGGVIQIFTRQGKTGETKPYFSAGVGSKNTQKATAGISGGDEDTRYNLSYSYLTTNGIDAQDTLDNPIRTYATPDHDGYRNSSLSFKVDHQLTDDWSVGANFIRANNYNEYDNGRYIATTIKQDPIHADTVQQVMGLNSSYNVNDTWTTSVSLAESRDRSQSYIAGQRYSHFNTRLRSVSWLNTLNLNESNRINLGVDYEHDSIESSELYPTTTRDNKGIFASWQANAGQHEWLLSARHDDNEAFGHRSTGTADYGYWIRDDLRISANVGTGFKTPTFNDLYYPGSGNPDVSPEKSTSYGIGLQGTPSWGSWSANAYQNNIRDLIAWADDGTGFWKPFNVNDAKIKGFEFEINTTLADWLVSFDASFLKPEDDNTGELLPRRAQRLANVHLDRQWGDWSTGASWKLRGRSYDTDDSRLGGYGLLDLRVGYQVDTEWQLRVTAQNMLDKDYETISNYYSTGRAVMLSVHYQP